MVPNGLIRKPNGEGSASQGGEGLRENYYCGAGSQQAEGLTGSSGLNPLWCSCSRGETSVRGWGTSLKVGQLAVRWGGKFL